MSRRNPRPTPTFAVLRRKVSGDVTRFVSEYSTRDLAESGATRLAAELAGSGEPSEYFVGKQTISDVRRADVSASGKRVRK